MRVRFDARSDAQEDALGPASLRRKLLQHGQLLEAVHHHVPHTDREGVLELLFGLVVAVKEDAFRREAGQLGYVELAARRHVDGEPLLQHQLVEGDRGEGLAGIDDLEVVGMLPEGLQVAAALVAHRLFVVDEQRAAQRVDQLHHIAPPDLQVAEWRMGAGYGIDERVSQGSLRSGNTGTLPQK